jgi:transposase-like protein
MAKENNLSNPIFQDADKAREWLEKRLWKDGPICPRCGVVNEATLMEGESHRKGLYQCNACREPFTVTVGTLYERSHVPLNKWLAATFLLMGNSKKGMSALQIGRMLGLSKKTSWFLCHRIREAVRQHKFTSPAFGKGGKTVEIDETYYGKLEDQKIPKRKRSVPYTKKGLSGGAAKRAIVSLVERGGRVKSFHVPRADAATAAFIVNTNISREAKLYTDESRIYRKVGENYDHQTVVHSHNEYVRGDVHTNTIENYFSVFKRGMRGIYQHCSEKHLHRYLAEFDYRYNHREAIGYDDAARFDASIPGIVGKRLTYRRTRGRA